MRLTWFGALVLAGAALLVPGSNVRAQAQDYPNRPVRVIIAFSPAGAIDVLGRLIADKLSTMWGQQVIVENRPGAGGNIGAAAAAQAAPDGYTLHFGAQTLGTNVTLAPSTAFHPVTSFEPIMLVGTALEIFMVANATPFQSVKEVIEYAKANPGKLTYASGNTTGIVAGETLKSKASIDILHVPYKSTPSAINDVLGGRVSMMFIDLAPGLEHVRAGNFRALAVTTKERSALLPDLPSLAEAGIPGYDVTSYAALFAPAGTPKEIVDRLNAEVRKIIDNPEVKARIAVTGFDAFSGPPESLAAFVQSELVNWGKLIKDAGIEPQ
jgi:tripartite-type tricarboxylate transporter receptor subunit TctC